MASLVDFAYLLRAKVACHVATGSDDIPTLRSVSGDVCNLITVVIDVPFRSKLEPRDR